MKKNSGPKKGTAKPIAMKTGKAWSSKSMKKGKC